MYKKGDKYKVVINNEEKYFRYTHDVTDYIVDNVSFAVDYYELSDNLKDLDKSEKLHLENDILIERIA